MRFCLINAGMLVSFSACLGGTEVTGPPALTLDTVATGLASPVYLTHAPGDFDRLFVVEQAGRIRIIENGAVAPAPFLDIAAGVSSGGESGLLGMAFHPDFPNTPYFYVNYTEFDGNLKSVIARYEVPAGTPDDADEASELRLLVVDQVAGNHNAGWMSFSPADGYLYFSLGDGGGACDPQGTGQDLDRYLGKMHRIDVDSASPYAVPPDNPFVGAPGLDEIWAYGLRNAWRCAFDSLTGDLYIADVGQGAREEVNFQPVTSTGGENYGWECREGTICATASGCTVPDCTCGGVPLVDPVTEYDHSVGCSITGGEVYRGCAIPGLEGTYFYGDYCSGEVWSFRMDGGSVTDFQLREFSVPGFSLFSFGRDAYGEIYICSSSSILKIVADGGPTTDCNENGAQDLCDIRDGSAADDNDNGVIDACETGPAIPAASSWGVLLMTLLIGAAATVLFRRTSAA